MAKVDNSSTAQSYDSVPFVEIDPGSHSSTTSAYKRYAVYSPNEWLLVFLSSMLALGLVVALAAIFWFMDNKPLPAWNSSVSLSTSISILTTAYAIALMQGVSTFIGQSKWHHFKTRPRRLADFETFDQASRGIWGSALLLATVKWNLASIGAAITILRLSFAPFAQQVVLLEQRDVISPIPNIATFGYALNYSRQVLFDSAIAAEAVVGSFPQDAGMQSAIFQGIYGVNTTEPFNCPGLCRWPGSYTSLGFKAECRNVTQQTLNKPVCDVPADQLDEYTHHCNMTTPGGVMVRSYISPTSASTAYYMNTTSLVPNELGQTFPDTFPEITRFAIYRATPDGDFYMRDTNITECSLYLTAYNYTDANANGSDFSFTSRTEVDFGVKNPWFVWSDTSNTSMSESSRLLTNELTRGDARIPALEIDYPNLQTLNNFFLSPAIVSEFIMGDLGDTHADTNLGIEAALIGDVDLDDRFDRMATAMTNYIRYGPNTQVADGEVIQSEPFVFIRWGYFAVPIAIEALAIVFALLSIFNNRRSRNVPLWKSSALAVLACQHNEQLELLQTTGKGIQEIQDEATTFRVQLQ